MAYKTLENISDLGIQQLLNYPNLDNPIFYPLFLFVVFFVFSGLSFFRELSREGKANLLSSLAVGGFVTIAISVILSLMDLIQTTILVTSVIASIIFPVWYLVTKKRS